MIYLKSVFCVVRICKEKLIRKRFSNYDRRFWSPLSILLVLLEKFRTSPEFILWPYHTHRKHIPSWRKTNCKFENKKFYCYWWNNLEKYLAIKFTDYSHTYDFIIQPSVLTQHSSSNVLLIYSWFITFVFILWTIIKHFSTEYFILNLKFASPCLIIRFK